MLDGEPDFSRQSIEELLDTLLRSSNNAKKIAEDFNIEELADIQRREARLTPAAFARLKAGIELGRRVQEAKTSYLNVKRIGGSEDAINYCKQKFSRLISDCLQEEFHIVLLGTKNQILGTNHITTGTLDASLVHPREVFRPAIRAAASSVLLAHNHPSGDPTPSREDIAVTNRLEQAGEVIGIDVLDHIVMGKQGTISIREYERA